MLDTLQPGQRVRVTITAPPRSHAARRTLERLMRLDVAVQRSLRRAQRRRRQQLVVYNRGGRDWYRRERCARVVIPAPGASWTMPFTWQIKPDLASISHLIRIEPA